MPEIDISKLATLDERDASLPAAPPVDARFPPAVAPQVAPSAPRAAPSSPRAAFAPPSELADAPLGVERSTRAIRIANQRERDAADAALLAPAPRLARPSPAPPSGAAPRSHAGVLFGVLAILAVAAGLFVFLRPPRPPPAHPGVTIRIVAPTPTAITIDGHAAGKTPLTLQRPRGATPITITAPGLVRQLVPDRDAVLDLAHP